ncbi:unnamed protein product [Peronospora destructor]|uniref:Phenylalanine ammonia-lyase n=1 Tax=Peronospora destructor TaxID=86335 RepID=A0AAV0VEJ9_9STRA|nr:unnamed protein product [Peronospora destructor]
MLSKGDTRNSLSEEAWKRVAYGHNVVDNILKDKSRVVYGINTGFGLSSNVIISPEKFTELQENLIRPARVAFKDSVATCVTHQFPSKGTVGVSGDFAPLAHLALGLMDEGPKWDKIGDQ